jgi:hypothetical protein
VIVASAEITSSTEVGVAKLRSNVGVLEGELRELRGRLQMSKELARRLTERLRKSEGRVQKLAQHTACIEGFFDVKKGVENAIKSTNFISNFCTLKSVIKLKLFLLCHSLFLEKFEFNYTFQGAKVANKSCTFYCIFYTLFYIKKSFYAGCDSRS